MFEDLVFNSFELGSRKENAVGIDTTNRYFIKIQLVKNSKKEKTLKGEFELMSELNKKGSRSCPKVYEFGTMDKDDVINLIDDQSFVESLKAEEFEFFLQDFVPDNGLSNFADLVFSMIEQKKLGVYQGDVKPANVRYDASKSLCYIIDYDQAIELSPEQVEMSNPDFFDFCSTHDKNKYGFGDWLRHFSDYNKEDVSKLFFDGSFDLNNCTIFGTQNTTNTINGIYHTIKNKDIFINGSRGIEPRANLLDTVDFRDGEKVLDVGCNSGLLSMYLSDRGCQVTGVDNDPHIVIAAKMISNILGKDADYKHLDLDNASDLEGYDTVMLFSVLHHTRDIRANAKKIAKSCSRIFLECRMFENGKQPSSDGWANTSNWNFPDLKALTDFCEEIFPNFKLNNNLGLGDKNRFILEFVK